MRDKNSQDVDRSIEAILSCAEQYIDNQSLTLSIVPSLMKLSPIEMTSKHDEIKAYLKKVESQQNYFGHKLGE